MGLSPHALQVLIDKHYKLKNHFSTTISGQEQEHIDKYFDFSLPKITLIQKSSDGTHKFLLKLKDNLQVESVLIPFHKKETICLSSQVGCAMNCTFCHTARQGLKRHLLSTEIIGIYLALYQFLKKNLNPIAACPNIVFMGQGEPLHNFDEIKKAIDLFTDKRILSLGPRNITLSTAGYLPGLTHFAKLHSVNLAISLHSAINEKRNVLIPLNKKYPLEQLLEELKKIPLLKKQFITFEYLLIDEFNDGKEDAKELAKFISHVKALVNIIPFNPYPGALYQRPSLAKINRFKEFLVDEKVRVMVRTTKGDDILAACGQLNTEENK